MKIDKSKLTQVLAAHHVGKTEISDANVTDEMVKYFNDEYAKFEKKYPDFNMDLDDYTGKADDAFVELLIATADKGGIKLIETIEELTTDGELTNEKLHCIYDCVMQSIPDKLPELEAILAAHLDPNAPQDKIFVVDGSLETIKPEIDKFLTDNGIKHNDYVIEGIDGMIPVTTDGNAVKFTKTDGGSMTQLNEHCQQEITDYLAAVHKGEGTPEMKDAIINDIKGGSYDPNFVDQIISKIEEFSTAPSEALSNEIQEISVKMHQPVDDGGDDDVSEGLLNQTNLSQDEYQKAKELKDFKKEDWTFDAEKQLYTKKSAEKTNEAGEENNYDYWKGLLAGASPEEAKKTQQELEDYLTKNKKKLITNDKGKMEIVDESKIDESHTNRVAIGDINKPEELIKKITDALTQKYKAEAGVIKEAEKELVTVYFDIDTKTIDDDTDSIRALAQLFKTTDKEIVTTIGKIVSDNYKMFESSDDELDSETVNAIKNVFKYNRQKQGKKAVPALITSLAGTYQTTEDKVRKALGNLANETLDNSAQADYVTLLTGNEAKEFSEKLLNECDAEPFGADAEKKAGYYEENGGVVAFDNTDNKMTVNNVDTVEEAFNWLKTRGIKVKEISETKLEDNVLYDLMSVVDDKLKPEEIQALYDDQSKIDSETKLTDQEKQDLKKHFKELAEGVNEVKFEDDNVGDAYIAITKKYQLTGTLSVNLGNILKDLINSGDKETAIEAITALTSAPKSEIEEIFKTNNLNEASDNTDAKSWIMDFLKTSDNEMVSLKDIKDNAPDEYNALIDNSIEELITDKKIKKSGTDIALEGVKPKNEASDPKDVAFFDVMFGLSHAVKKSEITEKDLDAVLDAVSGNRIKTDDLKKIISDKGIKTGDKLVADIIKYSQGGAVEEKKKDIEKSKHFAKALESIKEDNGVDVEDVSKEELSNLAKESKDEADFISKAMKKFGIKTDDEDKAALADFYSKFNKGTNESKKPKRRKSVNEGSGDLTRKQLFGELEKLGSNEKAISNIDTICDELIGDEDDDVVNIDIIKADLASKIGQKDADKIVNKFSAVKENLSELKLIKPKKIPTFESYLRTKHSK